MLRALLGSTRALVAPKSLVRTTLPTSQQRVEFRDVLRALPFNEVMVLLGHIRPGVADVVADPLERHAAACIRET